MTPFICQVSGQKGVGDCMRACIASILEVQDPHEVPHFFHDDCDGETAAQRIAEFLASRKLASHTFGFDPSLTVDEVLGLMHRSTGHYILIGNVDPNNSLAAHAVVCCGDKVVHDPAWIKRPMIRPTSDGHSSQWQIMVIAVA